MVNIGNDWDEIFKKEKEFEKDYYLDLRKFLVKEYKTKTIYPDKYEIFSDMFDYSVSLEYDKNYSLIQETVVVVNEYLENKGIDTKPFKLRITGKMENG